MDNLRQYRIGLYEKATPAELTWRERFEVAKLAGFDYIEMSIDETDERLSRLDWSLSEMDELVKQSLEAGVPIESICLSAQRRFPMGSGLPGAEEEAMSVVKKAVLLAARMGIRIIQVQGYDCYYNETTSAATKERFFRNLKKATEFAAQYGVILGMETMETDFLNTAEKSMYYVSQIDSPYLHVYPDIGNISNATQYVCRDIRTAKGHICAAHLKETVPGKFREIPFGTGHVDFPSAIRTLYDNGVRRYVAEFWYVKDDSDWRETLAFNRSFLDKQFTAAFSL